MNPLKRFYRLSQSFKAEIGQLYFYAVLNGLVGLTLPLGMQAIIQFLMAGQISTSIVILVMMVVVGLLISGWMQILQLTVSEHIQQQLFARGAFDITHRIPRIRLEKLAGQHLPELMNRFFDVVGIQKGLSKVLIDFTAASLQVVLGLILLSIYHPFFIAFSLLLVALLYILFRTTSPLGMKTSLLESKYKYRVAQWLEEMANSKTTFKLASSSNLPYERMDYEVDHYLEARMKHFKLLKTQYWSMVALKVIIALSMLVLGSFLVTQEQLNLGQFVAAEIIIVLVINAVEKILLNMDTIYDLLTSIEKVGYISELELESEDGKLVPSTGHGEPVNVHLEGVGFKYEQRNEMVLENIHLVVNAGEKISISGTTGSGKSTLLRLLSGIYQTDHGAITLNGLAMRSIDSHTLHSWIGQCLHAETIFQGTVLENIDLGRNIPLKKLQEVALAVGLMPFLEKQKFGLETVLYSEGAPLSRQATQRILLARCIAGNPGLVVYEDIFSELTQDEKKPLYDLLLNGPWTLIAVTNDAMFTDRCKQKYLLKEGKIQTI